jgi:hypothetical protein
MSSLQRTMSIFSPFNSRTMLRTRTPRNRRTRRPDRPSHPGFDGDLGAITRIPSDPHDLHDAIRDLGNLKTERVFTKSEQARDRTTAGPFTPD